MTDTEIRRMDLGSVELELLHALDQMLNTFSNRITAEALLNVIMSKVIIVGCESFGIQVTVDSLKAIIKAAPEYWEEYQKEDKFLTH